jgi:predicted porin
MKHKILVGLVAALASTGALAQSSVTIYGVLDTAVRYTTNANAAGDNKTVLGEGIFQGPRLGFKGNEDLGGGNAAVFDLEAGIVINNGQSDQQGQLFGRQAFVGLKNSSLGEIDFGRQYGLAFQTLGNYDPLGQGNALENEWELFIEGIRFDNTVEYTGNWGPVKAQVQYSFGGVAGATNEGSTTGFDLSYTQGPLSIGGVFQQSVDVNSNDATLWGLGGSYVAGPATLTLSYFDSKRDAGFAKSAALSGLPLANTSLTSNAGNTQQRKDDVWTAGVLWQVAPSLALTVGYMYDSVKNVTSTGNSGSIGTVYGVLDYNLSKRTDVYVELDNTKLSDGEITDVNSPIGAFGGGNSTRTGFALGLRTKF